MNNEEIENVNDRELFSELFDNPIHPLPIPMLPPFVDKKNGHMFHLPSKRGSNLEMATSLWTPEHSN